MKVTEAQELMQNIKAHYQTFNIENFVLEEWYKILKDYDFEEVMNKLVDHLTGNDYKDLPQVYQLVRDLQTIEEKNRSNKINNQIKVCCQLCERWMNMNEYKSHYGRCLDIQYLVRQSEKVGKPTTRAELCKLTQKQIEALLEKYKPTNKAVGVVRI